MTILYYRISLADDNDGDSDSIKNQRDLLRDYVHHHPDVVIGDVVEIQDDGFTGTNFERAGAKRILELVKNGSVKVLLVKDAYVKAATTKSTNCTKDALIFCIHLPTRQHSNKKKRGNQRTSDCPVSFRLVFEVLHKHAC